MAGGQDYTIFFKSRTSSAKRGAQEVQDELDKTSVKTQQLGEKTRNLETSSRHGFGSLKDGIKDARVQAGILVYALLKIRGLIEEFSQGQLQAEGERWLSGMTWDEFQALGGVLAGGGLKDEGAAKDASDLIGAMLDKASETRETGAFDFDFKTAGIDPNELLSRSGIGVVDYIREQIGDRELSPAESGAVDRLFSGDKRVVTAMRTSPITTEEAMAVAREIPDPTQSQLDKIGRGEFNRWRQEQEVKAQERSLLEPITDITDYIMFSDNIEAQLIRGIGGLKGGGGGGHGTPDWGAAPQRVEVVVDNPGFAIEQSNATKLGYY